MDNIPSMVFFNSFEHCLLGWELDYLYTKHLIMTLHYCIKINVNTPVFLDYA